MIYKSGEKVRVVKKRPTRSAHGFSDNMTHYLGKVVTICGRHYNTLGEYYNIKEDHGSFMWDKNMFQKTNNILNNE